MNNKDNFADFRSGSITRPTQYKSSTEQERFSKQVEKDLKRYQGKRFSQSVIRKALNDETSQWARQILNQKSSEVNSSNRSSSSFSPSSSLKFSSSISEQQASPNAPTKNMGSTAASPAEGFRFGRNYGDTLIWDPSANLGNGDWVIGVGGGGGGGIDDITTRQFEICENGGIKVYDFYVKESSIPS